MLKKEELQYQLNHHARLEEAWKMLDEDIRWAEGELARLREIARKMFEE